MLNGANSRMLARITGQSPHEEASEKTRTFDVVKWIRVRRLQWVGHIARMSQDRLVQQALHHIAEHRSEGDLLMDIPRSWAWTDLIQFAADRDRWRRFVRRFKDGPELEVKINGPLPRRKLPRRQPQLRPTPPPPHRTSSPRARAKKYIARDEHEAFFRPKLKTTSANVHGDETSAHVRVSCGLNI